MPTGARRGRVVDVSGTRRLELAAPRMHRAAGSVQRCTQGLAGLRGEGAEARRFGGGDDPRLGRCGGDVRSGEVLGRCWGGAGEGLGRCGGRCGEMKRQLVGEVWGEVGRGGEMRCWLTSQAL